uniref:Alcohol dehydrogenase putative n=1 Tax=Albugo laibachii Nc14 TaxID=890382 RepID=F0WYC6_9STRA|nr:alcohol dehydrogenase putative [Albugo laibachii Nc14]|eukprot:CCA26478.1 alcohol dehydrogenase putative [Albugo laibachii Nc14]
MEYVKRFTGGTHFPPETPTSLDRMKAITWQGGKKLVLESVKRPKILDSRDAIVRVSLCAIDGAFASQIATGDIPHMEKGQILGREAVGIIEERGKDVMKFSSGDRVVISFVIACGTCSYCKREEYSGCNCTNESKEFAAKYGGWAPAAVFGSSRMYSSVPGSQAEFVRVPFADLNCYKVPEDMSFTKALLVGDTVTTGYYAAELGAVKKGDTVVIWGLGPVGLMAADCCKLRGAKDVITIDRNTDRLKMAYEKYKCKVVDRGDKSSSQLLQTLEGVLPPGGADVVIDACGALSPQTWLLQMEKKMGMDKEQSDVLRECFTAVRKYGTVVIVGEYSGFADDFPIGHVMMKHLTIKAGRCPVQKYWNAVMKLIASGELDPTELLTNRVEFDELPDAYAHVANRETGYMKAYAKLETP